MYKVTCHIASCFWAQIVSCKALLIQPTLDTMGSLEVMVILGVKTFGLQSSCNLRLGNPNTIPIMVLHLFGFFCLLSCVMQEKLYSKTHGCCQYKLEGGSIPLTNLVIVEFVFNVFISKIGFQQFSLIVGAHINVTCRGV